MTTPLYEVSDLSVVYGAATRSRTAKVALRGVSLTVQPGETIGVVGESGSGKSSLANAMLGIVPAAKGVCRFRGSDISAMDRSQMLAFRKSVQMVFQDPFGSLNPRITVGGAIGEVMRFHDRNLAGNQPETERRVSSLLEQVELSASHAARYPHELSGGQRQRVVLARALAVDPQLLVADEPVSALDVLVQQQVLALLSSVQRARNMALVLVAHDLAVVHKTCERQVVLFGGMVMESGPSSLLIRPAHPYTRDLLAAVPSVERGLRSTRNAAMAPPTEVPAQESGGDSRGCPYRTRCRIAADRCAAEMPDLAPVAPGHLCRCHFAKSD